MALLSPILFCTMVLVQGPVVLADEAEAIIAESPGLASDDECAAIPSSEGEAAAACAFNALQRRAATTRKTSLPPPATTVAEGLFIARSHGHAARGVKEPNSFSCGHPGPGTKQPAAGPGGCLSVQPGISGFEGASPQVVASFLVEPCGIVAPHTHANAAEVNTVLRGQGVVAQLTTETNKLQVSFVKEGDSFVFERGAYHWWMNLGTEQLLTVGAFLDTGDPNAALMAYDDGAGVVGTLMEDQTLLHTLIGQSNGHKNTVPMDGGSPLFPRFTQHACDHARGQMHARGHLAATEGSFQKNPSETNLFQPEELQHAVFSISAAHTPVHGPGGGLRPLTGEVTDADMSPGDAQAKPPFDGGMAPTSSGGGPPQVALWPGFTNVAGGKSLVKFVVGYCGTVAIHTHVNAAEWNTVIAGSGQVSYYQVNTGAKPQVVTMNVTAGDTFVFPRGSAHWWVNYSPTEQLATIGGFTAPFPDTSLWSEFFEQSNKEFPDLVAAVLGEGFQPSRATEGGNLFPLLPSRSPPDCGGETPCHRC